MKRYHYFIIGLLTLLSIVTEFIANDDAILYQSKDGAIICGACKEWFRSTEYVAPSSYQPIITCLIPYDARTLEPAGFVLRPPGSLGTKGRHWLGTDSQSRDILAGIIYGLRLAILIGLVSALTASVIGVILGLSSSYFGDSRWRISSASFLLLLVVLCVGIYFAYYGASYIILFLCLVVGLIIFLVMRPLPSTLVIPVERIIIKLMDLFESIPSLYILLAIIGLIQIDTVWGLGLIIGLFQWPSFLRITRSEVRPWVNSGWIHSLRQLQLPHSFILFRQLVPLIIAPLSVHFAYTSAAAVSIEATLSFLGLGLSDGAVSWGTLLLEARKHLQSWWLIVFPGLSLFLYLWYCNILARELQARLRSPYRAKSEVQIIQRNML